jgi:uncharacterized protein YuzE
MYISYDKKTEVLYIRFDDKKQEVINRRISEDIVLDIGADDNVIGIEILDAPRHVNLEKLLPISYNLSS